MEPRKFFSLVVAGSHHFDEKQDPDLDPHKLDCGSVLKLKAGEGSRSALK
jgi:hypothetical protein